MTIGNIAGTVKSLKAPDSLPLCRQGCVIEYRNIRVLHMQAAVELSLIATGDARSKQPPKRAQAAPAPLRNGGPKPSPAAYSAAAPPVAPYQDPRRAPAAPAPQRASLFQSLAARPSQPANVTPVGTAAFRAENCRNARLVTRCAVCRTMLQNRCPCYSQPWKAAEHLADQQTVVELDSSCQQMVSSNIGA